VPISFIFEKRVLVQHVIEISDFPLPDGVLVVDRKQVHEVKPSQVGLESDNVFDVLFILRTK